VSFGIYDNYNLFKVYMSNANKDNVSCFRNSICSASCIEFYETDSIPEDFINVNPGDHIATISSSNGSLAYRVRRNGVNGIVTAGHVADNIASGFNYVMYSAVKMAVCTVRQNSGSVDAAFCENYYSYHGDSGGLVFTFNMSLNTGYTVGILKGGTIYLGVFTKASVANLALGITRY